MKVQHAESNVRGSRGIQEQKGFSIRTNAHAYKMLSSGLYSDKVGAVLREIACNAADAHIEAGTPDLPIEVKIPNRIDNQFYVKDWGPGLSHDDVMNLYTTYFASTKQSSNEFTGAFGLGSKSPFSYVDSFTVTSVHGGKKRTYSAHIGDEGVPTIALLTQEDADADWQHGVMIGFPVKPDDYQEFDQKARQIYRWFRVTPKIVGAAKVAKAEVQFDHPLFMRAKKDTIDGHGVVMGNVFYPTSAEQIQGLSPLAIHAFSFNRVVLKASIGDVQVAASREELQYDPQTTKFLVGRCDEVARVIATDAVQAARAFTTAAWKDKCAMKEIATKWSDHGYRDWERLFQSAGFGDAAEAAKTINRRHVLVPAWAGEKSSFRILSPGDKNVQHAVVKGGETGPKDQRSNATLDLDPETKVYYGRAPYALVRARHAIATGGLKQLVLVTPDFARKTTEAQASAEAKKLLATFAGMESEDVAKLPLPPGWKPKGNGTGKKVKGAPLPPMQPRDVVVWAAPNVAYTRKNIQLVKAPNETFMVTTSRGNVRVFDKSEDKDQMIDPRAWNTMWGAYHELQLMTKVPGPTEYVKTDAVTVRTIALPQRGWRTTHAVVGEWVSSQAVRDAVAQRAARWRPTVALNNYGNSSWVAQLVNLMHRDEKLYRAVATGLPKDLDDAVREIHDASVAAKGDAGLKQPKAITLFGAVQAFFGAPPIAMTGTRTYLSPEDLEAQTRAKYPLLALLDANYVGRIQEREPTRLGGFLELAFK